MGLGSSLGGIVGGVLGSVVAPGIGTAIGSGLGSAAGGMADSAMAPQAQAQQQRSRINYNSPVRKQLKQHLQRSMASQFAGMNSTRPISTWKGGLK